MDRPLTLVVLKPANLTLYLYGFRGCAGSPGETEYGTQYQRSPIALQESHQVYLDDKATSIQVLLKENHWCFQINNTHVLVRRIIA